MKREDVFTSWIPPGSVWSLWARAILFAGMPKEVSVPPGSASASEFDLSWLPEAREKTVIVIDLPAEESVWLGLALAGRGYRPVPLYNACTHAHEVINQGGIMTALQFGASQLANLPLNDAPPAFLLDDRRTGKGQVVGPGAFDNRYQIFPQDFPSAAFLLSRGMTQVLLIQRGRLQPLNDLAHVLRRWQEAGIVVLAKDLDAAPTTWPITVERPLRFRSMWHRFLEILGLRRGSLGGFGAIVPEPSKGGG